MAFHGYEDQRTPRELDDHEYDEVRADRDSMRRAGLAGRANRAATASRRAGAPTLDRYSAREDVIAWLQWCDPNGCHTDALARAEDIEPYTYETAWDALGEMLEGS